MVKKLRPTLQKGPEKISSPERRKRNELNIARMHRQSLIRKVEEKRKTRKVHPRQHPMPVELSWLNDSC